MIKHRAISALYPDVHVIRGDVAYDINENVVEYDEDLVAAWTDPNQYQHDRAKEYPSIGDQLDALFHAGVFPEEMAATIQAVKDRYPKS